MTSRESDVEPSKRQAIEMLLDWGFTPAVIAHQLGCSVAWVYRLRKTRTGGPADSGMRMLVRQFRS